MSPAPVAAERSTRSAAEGERVNAMSGVTVTVGLEVLASPKRRITPQGGCTRVESCPVR
jgi:hypothetical protein